MLNYYENTNIPKDQFIMNYYEESGSIIVVYANNTKITVPNKKEMKKKIQKLYYRQVKKVLKNNYSNSLKRKCSREQSKLENKLSKAKTIAIVIEYILAFITHSSIPLLIVTIIVDVIISVIIINKIRKQGEKALTPLKNKMEEVERLELWEENEETINQHMNMIATKEQGHSNNEILKDHKEEVIDSVTYDIIDLDQKTLPELKQILEEIKRIQEYGEDVRISSVRELGNQKTIGTMPNNH